jgi:RNA polymerase sigma-70 factor (ECF subfamily)
VNQVPNEPQPVSDEVLAREAQRGSLSAFEELVHRYEARIYRFVANNCRNESDAREVTQETFVSAYRKVGQFDVKRSFVTWLFTIARRKCIDRHRAARRVEGQPLPELADENTPAELLARREGAENLWRRARNILSEAHFQSLWLKYAEDLSVADIARVMGRTRTHVKVMLFRARHALARELEKPGVETSATLRMRKPHPLASKFTGVVRGATF